MDQQFPFLDLSRQRKELETEINEAAQRVFSRGVYVLGDEVMDFEREWAQYCGVAACAGLNSGTDAIALALTASGAITQPGVDEVITSPVTAGYTALGILQAGGVPVFADVNAADLLIDANSIERAITPRTKAIVPVHLYGQIAQMENIFGIATRHGIKVIEDAAQAHGAWRNEPRHGNFPRTAAFSFYPTKNLGAYGDAGAVVSDDTDLIEQIKNLRQGGHPLAMEQTSFGGNSRLDELQAAMLRIKLKYLDDWNERRRRWAALYSENFSGSATIIPVSQPGRRNAHHLFVVQTEFRDELQNYLAENLIPSMVHYPIPLHKTNLFSRGSDNPTLRVAEAAAGRILSLPLNSHSFESEILKIVEFVLKFNSTLAGAVSLQGK